MAVVQGDGEPTIPAPSPAAADSAASEPLPAQSAGDGLETLLNLVGISNVEPTDHSSTAELLPPTMKEPLLESGGLRVAADSMAPASTTTPGLEETPSDEDFVGWLRRRIEERKFIINDAKALVHTVADTTYLVSPGVFQRYAQEHSETTVLAKQDQVADWQWVQKRFEKLQLHRKQEHGLNIWTCTVTGPRKSRRLHGYLMEDPGIVFTDVPPNNPYLSMSPASHFPLPKANRAGERHSEIKRVPLELSNIGRENR